MRRFIFLATILVATAFVVPTATATAPNGTATPAPPDANVSVDVPGFPSVSSSSDCTERVGPMVDLCSAERVDDGTVALVLVHKTGGSVTLTDSFRDGDIPRESYRIGREPTRIEFSIVPDNAGAKVTIDTGRNLYGETIESPSSGGILPRPSKLDALSVGATVALLAPLLLLGTWYGLKRWQGGVRRVA